MLICNEFTHSSHVEGIKGLIFDCDGVLFDSWESNKHYYNLLLNHLGLPAMSPEQEAYVHCHTVGESMDFIIPEKLKKRIPEARAAVDYTQALPYLKPEPGLYDVLQWLRDKGMRMAIATNRTTTMPLLMDLFSLRPFFSYAYTAGTAMPKPHPEAVYLILEKWGLLKKEVAFIGDSEVDQQTAANAQVRFWAYRAPILEADMHIPDYFSLRNCLRKVLDSRPKF